MVLGAVGNFAVLTSEQYRVHALMRFQDAIDVFATKTICSLSECMSEEATDAAIPRLDPFEDAATTMKLVLPLFQMIIDLRRVNHPRVNLFANRRKPNNIVAFGQDVSFAIPSLVRYAEPVFDSLKTFGKGVHRLPGPGAFAVEA